MSLSDCPIQGTATAQRINDAPEWLTADPEVHISNDLLRDAQAVAWICERYRLDEPCPHADSATHARLLPAPTTETESEETQP